MSSQESPSVRKWAARESPGRKRVRSSSRIQKRYENRRLEILRAAGRAFREHGLAETGMREIAKAADLSPANLYNYFQGKHELLFFCQESALDLMLKALQEVQSGEGTSAEKLAQAIEAHLRCVLDEVGGATAHLFTAAMPPHLQRKLAGKRDRYEDGIRQLIAEGVRSGEFVECDPALAARAILGALNWSTGWFNPEGELKSVEVARQFAKYFTRGLAADHAPNEKRESAVQGRGA